MQFKQYPSYKPSGVEWLGDVPEHWQQKPIWSLFKRIKRTNFPTERLLSVYRDYGVIPKDSRDDNHNRASEDLTPYQLVCANDLVINKMKAWQGSIAISELRGIVSPAYYIYQPKAEYHSKYIHFLIRSAYYIQSYKNYSKGIRVNQWDLESEAFTHIDLLLPSLDEQQKIVSFLDTETTRIDNLIAKQEKLIELLEEQRKSIISHAVTKGLNPNAPMKDSGVEWLGEVPENFNCIKLKQLAIGKLTYGANESADQEVKEHPRYIRITDIKEDGTLHPETFKSLSPETAEQYLLSNNDILFARSGATVGKTFKYSDSWGVCCFAGYLIKISINAKIANPDYIFYYLNSHAYWEYVSSNQSQSTIQNVSAEKYANFTIAVPKLAEQNAIVNYLNKETERLNILIAKQKTLIEKLKEYRSSIISHAVTGKIDIREFC